MLLSRLAERVYWLGRYLERAEDLGRAVLTHSRMCLDMPHNALEGFTPLLELSNIDGKLMRTRFGKPAGLLPILRVLVLEDKQEASLLSVVGQARENARACRAIIPEETWESLNRMHLNLLSQVARPGVLRIERSVEKLIVVCQQIHTQLSEGMSRDDAFLFLQAGRYIERADMLLRITQVSETLGSVRDQDAPFADVRWMGMLQAQNAYQVYRREYQGRADLGSTLRFLLSSQKFPRSLWFSLSELARALALLPHGEQLLKECEALRAFALPRDATEPRLYAQGLFAGLASLSDGLYATYFRVAQD